MDKIRAKEIDRLFCAMMTLENVDEFYEFFSDVCTVKELKEMAARFDVAYMLENGSIYNEISEKTGASTATISRVNKCLQYGNDGYKKAITRLKQKEGRA